MITQSSNYPVQLEKDKSYILLIPNYYTGNKVESEQTINLPSSYILSSGNTASTFGNYVTVTWTGSDKSNNNYNNFQGIQIPRGYKTELTDNKLTIPNIKTQDGTGDLIITSPSKTLLQVINNFINTYGLNNSSLSDMSISNEEAMTIALQIENSKSYKDELEKEIQGTEFTMMQQEVSLILEKGQQKFFTNKWGVFEEGNQLIKEKVIGGTPVPKPANINDYAPVVNNLQYNPSFSGVLFDFQSVRTPPQNNKGYFQEYGTTDKKVDKPQTNNNNNVQVNEFTPTATQQPQQNQNSNGNHSILITSAVLFIEYFPYIIGTLILIIIGISIYLYKLYKSEKDDSNNGKVKRTRKGKRRIKELQKEGFSRTMDEDDEEDEIDLSNPFDTGTSKRFHIDDYEEDE